MTSIQTEYWEESDTEITEDLDGPPLPEESNDPTLSAEQVSIIQWIMLFVSLFMTLHVIPQRAIDWLLCFLGALLNSPGRHSAFIQGVALAFPSSLHLMKFYMEKNSTWNTFCKYVVCPKCHSLYKFEETYEKRGTQFFVKSCQHVAKTGRVCGSSLLKRIVTGNGIYLV